MDDGWQEMNDGGQGMDDDGFKDCNELFFLRGIRKIYFVFWLGPFVFAWSSYGFIFGGF